MDDVPVCFVCLEEVNLECERVYCRRCKKARICLHCLDDYAIRCLLVKLTCPCGMGPQGFAEPIGRINHWNKMMTYGIREALAARCVAQFKWTPQQAVRAIWGFLDYYYATSSLSLPDHWYDLRIIPSPIIDKVWNEFQSGHFYAAWQQWLGLHPDKDLRVQRFRVWPPPDATDASTLADERYKESCRFVSISAETYPRLVDPMVWPSVDVTEGTYQVFVKTLDGSTMTVPVRATDKIKTLKHIVSIADRNWPLGQMRLVFGGEQSNDNATMEESGIIKESTVHLLLRLAGD